MSFTDVDIDPGTSPTVPVATDTIGGIAYQRVKLADATADATTAIGVDANPLRVRDRRRGTSDYDSGNVAVASTLTAVTTATIYAEGGYVTNITASEQWLSLTNTANTEHLSQWPIAPRETRELPFKLGMLMVGIKAQASNVTSLRLHIWGAQ